MSTIERTPLRVQIYDFVLDVLIGPAGCIYSAFVYTLCTYLDAIYTWRNGADPIYKKMLWDSLWRETVKLTAVIVGIILSFNMLPLLAWQSYFLLGPVYWFTQHRLLVAIAQFETWIDTVAKVNLDLYDAFKASQGFGVALVLTSIVRGLI